MNTHTPLSILLGGVTVTEHSDCLVLQAENGWSLSIYSKYAVHSASQAVPQLNEAQCLSKVDESEAEARLSFSDGHMVVVDLSDDGFLGPEAMVLSGPNAEFVVWN